MTSTYPKIEMVLDVTTLTFEQEEVISASVVEEVHPISTQIPIGKLEFRVISYDDDFSMFSGSYLDLLADRPPVTAYEVVDSVEKLLGKFYLDDWENISENEYSFEAMDIIGVLDKTPFEGIFYSALTSVTTILAEILGGIDVTYDLDSYIGAKTLKGWIPPGTYRTALQQICFAAGAVAVAARDEDIQIVREKISDYYAIFDDFGTDYMKIPAYSPVGNDFTIEILTRVNSYQSWGRMLEYDDGNPEILFYLHTTNKEFNWEIEDDSSVAAGSTFGAGGDITDELFHHFALTVNKTTDKGIGYLDLVAGSEIDLSGLGNITITNDGVIGCNVSLGGGTKEDVVYIRIWSDVRTHEELVLNAYRRTPLDETGLERNHTFRELDETDFKSGEDGTFNGTITFGRTPGEYVLPTYDSEVEDTEKTSENPVKLKPLVTSIELVSHNYSQSTELLDIYEEDLDEGPHKIIFDQPLYGIVISGPGYVPASLVLEDDLTFLVTEDGIYEIEVGGAYAFGSNSVSLQVSAPGGTVTITGYPYVDSQRAFTFYETGILPTTDLNALDIPSATLISPENVEEILDLLRDYYQIRYEQQMTLFPTTIKPNDVIQTSTLHSNEIAGVVEKMELDLTRGYLARTRMIGREV